MPKNYPTNSYKIHGTGYLMVNIFLLIFFSSCLQAERKELQKIHKVLEETKSKLEEKFDQSGKIELAVSELQLLKEHCHAALRGDAILSKKIKLPKSGQAEAPKGKIFRRSFCEKYLLRPVVFKNWQELCSLTKMDGAVIDVCPYDFSEYGEVMKRWCE